MISIHIRGKIREPNTIMNWIKRNWVPSGFDGAENVLVSETHILALWNHDQCRGWQLYILLRPPKLNAKKWVAGAGYGSTYWSEDQAIAWANLLIK